MNNRAIDHRTIEAPNLTNKISKAVSLAALDIGIMLAVLQTIIGIIYSSFDIGYLNFVVQEHPLFFISSILSVVTTIFIILLLLVTGTFAWCSLWNRATPRIRFKGLLCTNAIAFMIWLWLGSTSMLTTVVSLLATLILCIGGMGILSSLVILRSQASYAKDPHHYDRINYVYLLIGIFIFPCISGGLILIQTPNTYSFIYLTIMWLVETILLYRHAPSLDKPIIIKPRINDALPVLKTSVSRLLFWAMIVFILIIWDSANIVPISHITSIDEFPINNIEDWSDFLKMPAIYLLMVLSGFYIVRKIIFFQGIHQAISITALLSTLIASSTLLFVGFDAGHYSFSLDGVYPIRQYVLAPIVDYGLSSLLLGFAMALIVSLARNEAFNRLSNRYVITLSCAPIIIIIWRLTCQYIEYYYWTNNAESILRITRAILCLIIFFALFRIMDSETDYQEHKNNN